MNLKISGVQKASGLVTKIHLPSSKNEVLNCGDTFNMSLWVQAPHKKGNHRLDLLFYYENPHESNKSPKYRLCRHTWQLTVLESIKINAITRKSAISHEDSPTLNLTLQVKNTNQVQDPFMNEISMTQVLLQSESWCFVKSTVLPTCVKVQPQETSNLLLKLHRKLGNEEFSKLQLNGEKLGNFESPFSDFVQRRNGPSLINEIISNEFYQQQQQKKSLLADTLTLSSTLILMWRAQVTEGGSNARQVVGQHHVDFQYLNKLYTHPDEPLVERNTPSRQLKIFGPDKNILEFNASVKKELYSDREFKSHAISFNLNHTREIQHNFIEKRLCVVPVLLRLQNHSQSFLFVKVNTIGTSR